MISPDDLAQLRQLVNRLRTQDHRMTADPIFMVQERHRQYGMDEEYAEHYCFVYADDSDIEVNEESDPARFMAFSDGEFGEDDPEFWTRTGYVDTWLHLQPFLTEAAAEAFIQRERHNHRTLRIYAESAHRNPELRLLLRTLGPLVAHALALKEEDV